jgi:hypothetical protein
MSLQLSISTCRQYIIETNLDFCMLFFFLRHPMGRKRDPETTGLCKICSIWIVLRYGVSCPQVTGESWQPLQANKDSMIQLTQQW